MSEGQFASILRQVPLLAGLSDEEVQDVAAIGKRVTMKARAPLFQEGDPGDALYVILAGEVRVFIEREGEVIELSRLSVGDYFGEIALLDGAPRSASVATAQDSTLFRLERPDFMQLMTRSPQLLSQVLAAVSTRIRRSNELEQEHRKVAAELEHHKNIAEIVSDVAHDINTPLGVINQMASYIDDAIGEEIPAEVREDEEVGEALMDIRDASRLILGNIQRASGLIQAFKKLSVEKVEESRQTVDITEVLAEALAQYRVEDVNTKLKVEVEVEVEESKRAWRGYPTTLAQIVVGLLANVNHHAYPKGSTEGASVSLSYWYKSEDSCGYQLVVSDRGRGIPQENLSQVFTPFFTTDRGGGRVGMGLAVVHNLATGTLCGSMDLQSSAGAGTTITIRFPQVIVGPPNVRASTQPLA